MDFFIFCHCPLTLPKRLIGPPRDGSVEHPNCQIGTLDVSVVSQNRPLKLTK